MAALFQIRGADSVLDAYNNREVKCWAVFQGKNLLTKGTGAAELESFLELIEGGSRATYTLKIFEDIEDPKQIKEKTEADGSFNFVLYPEPGYLPHGEEYNQRRYGKAKSPYLERLEALEDRVNGGEVDGEGENSMGNVFMGLLKNPSDLVTLIQAGREAIQLFMNPTGAAQFTAAPAQVARIGNTDPQTSTRPAPSQEDIDRLQMAINTLEKNDPKLIAHLEKLAQLSVNSSGQFKFLTSMLDNM